MHTAFGNKFVADCFERQVGKALREESGEQELFLSGGKAPAQWLSGVDGVYTTKCFKQVSHRHTIKIEVFEYKCQKGPSLYWWSAPWLRQVVFPEVRHHTWCGKNAPQLLELLVQFGLAEDHLRFSNQSVMHRRRHGGVVSSEQPQAPTIAVSSAACLALSVYWHMKAVRANASVEDGVDMAGILVDALLQTFFGDGRYEVRLVAMGDSTGVEIQDSMRLQVQSNHGRAQPVQCVFVCDKQNFTAHLGRPDGVMPGIKWAPLALFIRIWSTRACGGLCLQQRLGSRCLFPGHLLTCIVLVVSVRVGSHMSCKSARVVGWQALRR